MRARLYRETEYICEILNIPTSGGYREVLAVVDNQIVERISNHFVTDRQIDYGMGKNHYLVYVKGLGFFPVVVTSVTPQEDGTFKCEYMAFLKPPA